MCADLNLYGKEILAVDGTRLKAVNKGDKNFTKGKLAKQLYEMDQRLETYFKDMAIADRA